MSRKLIQHLMRFHGVDTDLFQEDAEWELAEGFLRTRVSEADMRKLEGLAAQIQPPLLPSVNH